MNRQSQNILLIAAALLLVVLVGYFKQEPLEWELTWHESDRQPLGGYVLHQLAGAALPEVQSRYRPLTELAGEEWRGNSWLVITPYLELDPFDSKVLDQRLREGATVVLAAQYFKGPMLDSLPLRTRLSQPAVDLNDPGSIVESSWQYTWEDFPQDTFKIPAYAPLYHFVRPEGSNSRPFRDLAVNNNAESLLRYFSVGKGHLFVTSQPQVFSNWYLIQPQNRPLASGLFSLFPQDRPLQHVEYYRMGRMEPPTPLRYLLSQPPLRAALYTGLVGMILFMFFQSKRRQRPIPVVRPPQNASRQFARTLGQLYYHNRTDHRNMMEKRLRYWLEYVHRHFYLSTDHLDDDWAEKLARKTGQPVQRIRSLARFASGRELSDEEAVSYDTMILLDRLLYRFYRDLETEKVIEYD